MAASAPSTVTGGWSTCEDWSWCCASVSAVSRASSASSFPRRAFWFASTFASESRSVAISASSRWRFSPRPARSPRVQPRDDPRGLRALRLQRRHLLSQLLLTPLQDRAPLGGHRQRLLEFADALRKPLTVCGRGGRSAAAVLQPLANLR